jgi:hypothetical protein
MISYRLINQLTENERLKLAEEFHLETKNGYMLIVITQAEYDLLQDIQIYYDRVNQQEYINRIKGK